MNKHQKKVDDWFKKSGWPYWQPHEIMVRLMEETGELARLINHIYGPKQKKSGEATQEMEEEIGDIIYTLICLANSQGLDLDKCTEKSISKVVTRDKDRYSRKAI